MDRISVSAEIAISRAMDIPEQDAGGLGGNGDGLPTYENLAEAHGPNSRYGLCYRFVQGMKSAPLVVQVRQMAKAAERYAGTTPEELESRRRRGWGDDIQDGIQGDWATSSRSTEAIPQDGPSTPGPSNPIPALQVQTEFDILPSPPIQPNELLEYDPSKPIAGESLRPAHLALHQLGSRFLPHTTSPIRALLPLLGDRLLLIGHDDGLSVLNMFPQELTDVGLQTRGPGEAEAHPIWTGEGVFQMSLLEVEEIGESTPQGVVLFLVGCDSENGKDQEQTRILRMYNLAGLISLARWAISQKGARPLNLHRPPGWHPHQSTSKKHKRRHSGNLTKGLRSLMLDSSQPPEPTSSYQSILQISPGVPRRSEFKHSSQARLSAIDSGWDVVDDLPLRWATDYVPLAVPGSRLMNASVLTYALWRNDNLPRSSALLAVAIKSAVLLYESPKGERAFRFVKEFYTPLLPRGITFVYQNLQDNLSRSLSDATGNSRSSPNNAHARGSRRSMRERPTSLTTMVLNPQLCLFVVFEKKVGLIRLINSAVGEVTLLEEAVAYSPRDTLSPSSSSLSGRRSRTSLDGFGMTKEYRGAWTLPAKLDLPAVTATPSLASIDRWDASSTNTLSTSATTTPVTPATSSAPLIATGASLPEEGISATSPTAQSQNSSVYLVTRGKQSFLLPCPLPANMQAVVPLQAFSWRSPPSYIAPRVIELDYPGRSGSGGSGGGGGGGSGSGGVRVGGQHSASSSSSSSCCERMPMSASASTISTTTFVSVTTPATATARGVRVLQLTAFGGEDGLEIQETVLSSLFTASASAKERGPSSRGASAGAGADEPPIVSEVVDIGDTGFLCGGGHWHRPYDAPLDLRRSYSTSSAVSFDSLPASEVMSRLESDQGIYGWQRKGLQDWRVFWVGGTGETDDE
ncbi:hypothetical protein BC827DRAFT_1268217 [Russula dissimulans]|nr:hypothetical protein BC827DRAFT_1268217 [Russula dissimulans]